MQGKFFQTRTSIQSDKHFCLELLNVTKYNPIGLEKIKLGKGISGVFNYIKIQDHGKKLTIVSQDLRIELELTQLAGNFKEIQP